MYKRQGSISLFDGALLISGETIVTVLANIVIMLALTQFTGRTKMGKAMRAVSEAVSYTHLDMPSILNCPPCVWPESCRSGRAPAPKSQTTG